MPLTLKRTLILLLLCVVCLTTTRSAKANIGYASDAKAAGVIVAVVAVGALVGVGVYYALNHGHSLRGCASSTADGLQLRSDADQQNYLLIGDIAGIRPGERVRVAGNKQKHARSGHQFFVRKLAKDYGVCKVPAAPWALYRPVTALVHLPQQPLDS